MKKLLFYISIIIISVLLCAIDYLYDQGLIIPTLLLIAGIIYLNFKILSKEDLDEMFNDEKY